MSATTDRDNAITLARHDPKAALARAQKIADPWFRSQALAWVAWLTPDDSTFRYIISEAVTTALGASDPYQRVGACAWPVRALAERHNGSEAIAAMRKALSLAPQIENPVPRADALFLLFQAVLPIGVQSTQQVVAALIVACSATDGWKGQHILRDVALMLAAVDLDAAKQVVSAMRDGREHRQAERRIAERQFISPRDFFWKNPKGSTEP